MPTSQTLFPDWAAHAPLNAPLRVRDTESALGRMSRETRSLSLKDVALVHGHLCDGLVVAWVELGVALRDLFPDGVVDRTDVRVVSRNGPCRIDAAAWTTGARVNHGTLALDNAIGNGFVVQRMSTRKTVRVELRDFVFPERSADPVVPRSDIINRDLEAQP